MNYCNMCIVISDYIFFCLKTNMSLMVPQHSGLQRTWLIFFCHLFLLLRTFFCHAYFCVIAKYLLLLTGCYLSQLCILLCTCFLLLLILNFHFYFPFYFKKDFFLGQLYSGLVQSISHLSVSHKLCWDFLWHVQIDLDLFFWALS